MCLVELVSLQLPWHGYGGTAEVPLKVTRGERPEAQLQRVAHLADLQVPACLPAADATAAGYMRLCTREASCLACTGAGAAWSHVHTRGVDC
jgi:hypothetical protein